MKIKEATSSTVTDLWSDLDPSARRAAALEEAAQSVASALHAKFEDSVVLARVYVTCPYGSLPHRIREFVRKLADGAGAAQKLGEATPVLSLVGTHGQEPTWNDRRNSQGHVGIPLVSASFVDAIPMMSRLLGELGVPVQWADTHDFELIKKMGTGLFFVEHAAESTDHYGRRIIPAQDFVTSYEVKSVFGAGTAYPNGQIVVLIVFTRDVLSRDMAERFLPLVDRFRDGTSRLADAGAIFSSS